MSKRIIAIDPGEMTGWAIGRIQTYECDSDEPKQLLCEQFGYDPWKKFVMNLDTVQLGDSPFDIIVYESFRIRSTAAKALIGSDVPTAQCIGAIKLAAWRSGAKLVTSEPSNKPVIDRQMGGAEEYLPKRDQVEHYRDAVRHLHWYAINKEGIAPDDTRRL
ncbi:MAG: hypothetical protein OJJ55_19015 [Rhodococcus sp.]|nr:hypothetical protein [Rhodococcus sp. (in: high G+C Gram-positive bacteria)]